MSIVNGQIADADEVRAEFTSIANQQLEQDINILINSAAIASSLNPYDTMFLDIFSDATGYSNTVDTGNTTAIFNVNKYDFTSFALTAGSESKTSTNQTGSSVGGYTCNCTANDNIIVTAVYVDANAAGSTTTVEIIQNAQIIATKSAATTGGAPVGHLFTESDYSRYIQSGQAFSVRWYTSGGTAVVYYLSGQTLAGTYFSMSSQNIPGEDGAQTAGIYVQKVNTFTKQIVQTNAQSITANPIAHLVYCHETLAGSGSVTYDISFDGGTTWETDQTLFTYNTDVHAGSSLKIKLNLNGTDKLDASAKDYAVLLYY